MADVTHSTYLSGPRGADIAEGLLAVGQRCHVRVRIDTTISGLFRKTIYFTVTGEQADINDFVDSMVDAIHVAGYRTRG